jgi:hypothetical protein
LDNKRHGFDVSAKSTDITEEMRQEALNGVQACAGVSNARFNPEGRLIVTHATFRQATTADEKIADLVERVCKTIVFAMLNEAKAANKRAKAAKTSQRREARKASYLNQPSTTTSPTL